MNVIRGYTHPAHRGSVAKREPTAAELVAQGIAPDLALAATYMLGLPHEKVAYWIMEPSKAAQKTIERVRAERSCVKP